MLTSPLASVLRTTKPKLEILERMGLRTVLDLLEYFPRAYEDMSSIVPISTFSLQEKNTAHGFLSAITGVRTKYGKQIQRATFTDDAGDSIECVWFHQQHLVRMYSKETEVLISGMVKRSVGTLSFVSPVIELYGHEQIHTARIVPIYPETEGITSKWLREKIQMVLPYADSIQDFLPEEYIFEQNFPLRAEAVKQLHFPDTKEQLEKARERMAFEESFLLQLNALQSKREWQKKHSSVGIPMNVDLVKTFISSLPFALTGAQKIVLYEILQDMQKDTPMIRLVEGDVGCGKTVVAAIAAFNAIRSGFQCAVMAPTEILAKQHFIKFCESYQKLDGTMPRVELLVGSFTLKEKQRIHRLVASGDVDMIIGTHALIQDAVTFKKLGLAIIDEQHRFGVEQRARLAAHNKPHLLMMTATPIPRTLALTMYGDQDLSVIDEMPPGRKPVITRVIPPDFRVKSVLFIADQIKKGRQVFVICPLINESEKTDLKSVLQEYERLRDHVFPQFRIAYLHGKMRAEEKDAIMNDFKEKHFDILVSTSVIEVGIDIPNATVMMIESAERFGLAQLHQFRGRVGRAANQSYCFLFVTDDNEGIPRRLRAMEKHTDGFKLAEIDLEIRGPGQVYGLRQSGLPDFKLANIMDGRLIARSRKYASDLLEKDANLSTFELLKHKVQKLRGGFLNA